MKAAIVTAPGKAPIYGEFRDPVPKADEELVTVAAAALTHLTKGRASGAHYSSSANFPAVPGVDGVGRTEDGRRVYFALPDAPFGGMAEKVAVKKDHCTPVPDDVDDVTAAAIANPGMSCWAALKERAHFAGGENVLINGATGSSGRIAIQVAKYLGAKNIIATGRDAVALDALKLLGATQSISLKAPRPEVEAAFKEVFSSGGVDVILDYLWGESAQILLTALAKGSKDAKPIRYVQIGSLSGEEIPFHAAVLRSTALVLMGSGIGSVSLKGLLAAISEVLKIVVPARLKIETTVVLLADVADAWSKGDSRSRIVFVTGKS